MGNIMNLNYITRKLVKNNINKYVSFAFSIIFVVSLIGAFGVLQFSPTVVNVIMDGGSTQSITLSMFGATIFGALIFLIYSHSLFLRYKSKDIGIFISLGIKRDNIKKIIIKEQNIIILISSIIGLVLSIPIAWLSFSLLTLIVKTDETAFTVGWTGLVIASLFSIIVMLFIRVFTSKHIKKLEVIKILKIDEEIEHVKGDNYILRLLGFIMIPIGIILNTSLKEKK